MFTAEHRGGAGPPMVCLHGFADTWRTWELVLPYLERRHDVLAPTLAGHAGAPEIEGEVTAATITGAVERAMDAAGFATAHLVGNSLGGHVALQLAARGRARSVVALAPAGGWKDGGPRETIARQRELLAAAKAVAPHAAAITATPEGRRRAMAPVVDDAREIPAELIAHIMLGVAACPRARDLLDAAADADWTIDAARIECPVRIVWGREDRLLPWPSAAARFREDWLPHADWVELAGVGHCPQLEVPLPAAQLILAVTSE